MRLLVTADLHYNHGGSRPIADALIDRINADRPDSLLLIGDTAAGDSDDLESCLNRFQCDGPKLFLAGNHELWTQRGDSYRLFMEELPQRIRAAGWHWLEGSPVILADGVAVAGSVGWYDYTFALPLLGIPLRFYEAKISPAAAERFPEYAHLFDRLDDISPTGRSIAARWNDGRHVHLGRSDPQFLAERLAELEAGLTALQSQEAVRSVLVAVHHVPLEQLMPPKPTTLTARAFAGGFLGSPLIGERVLRFSKVRRLLCGHSHLPMQTQIGLVSATNIGSGYRWKTYLTIETANGQA